MKEKTERQKLVAAENLMHAMSQLDETVIPKDKLDSIKAEFDKTKEDLDKHRKKKEKKKGKETPKKGKAKKVKR